MYRALESKRLQARVKVIARPAVHLVLYTPFLILKYSYLLIELAVMAANHKFC